MPPKSQQQDTNSTVNLSKAQEDEMNSALIAKLLAEDAMDGGEGYYYGEYSNNSQHYDIYKGNNSDLDDNYEEESDDYAPKRYGKPKKAKAKKAEQAERRGRKRKNASMDVDVDPNPTSMEPIIDPTPTSTKSDNDGETITPEIPKKVKKVKKPLPPGFKTGFFTDDEEKLFLEGLDLYGRGWNELSRHMGTRDPHSIRSHAQKHFIKFCLAELPLPDKVKESGDGYTLSGKPLILDSAAVRPYLKHYIEEIKKGTIRPSDSMLAALAKIDNTLAKPTGDTEQQSDDVSKGDHMQIDLANSSEATNGMEKLTVDLDIGRISLKPTKQNPPPSVRNNPGSSSKAKKQVSRQDDLPVATYDDNGRTNYAVSRLRQPESRNSVTSENSTIVGDGLMMMKCEAFNGKPGSDALGAQPFEMMVHSNALLTMDFHAHLMSSEVIGFLSGEWNKPARRLTVKEAFPCQTLNTGQNDVNVEMDPASSLEIRQLIEDKGMNVVGWYHSHPVFVPDPSLVDIETQLNYQNLCRDECHTTASVSTPVNIIHDSPETPSLAPLHNDDHDNTERIQIPELSNSNSKSSLASTPSSTPSPTFTTTIEPFVGAIIGPYDPKLPASTSVFNWFHVTNARNEQNIPKKLHYELQEDMELSVEEKDRMLQLPSIYQTSCEKVNFNDRWRQDSQETKLEKLIKSLGARMPWIQRKLLKLKEQETTSHRQQNNMGTSSSGVEDILICDSENIDGIGTTENQISAQGDNGLTDAFLEKVQATLKNW